MVQEVKNQRGCKFLKMQLKMEQLIYLVMEHKHEILFMLKIYAKEFFLPLIIQKEDKFSTDSNSKANVYKKFGEGDKKDHKKDNKNVIKINYKKRDGDVLMELCKDYKS